MSILSNVFIIGLFIGLGSCQSEKIPTKKELIGEWKVVRATGRLADSSIDAIFTFGEDDIMSTDKVRKLDGVYSINGEILTWEIADTQISYKMKMKDDILFLYPTSINEEMELHRQ